jgi:hypothetical protein
LAQLFISMVALDAAIQTLTNLVWVVGSLPDHGEKSGMAVV